jgi:hypothetical protein
MNVAEGVVGGGGASAARAAAAGDRSDHPVSECSDCICFFGIVLSGSSSTVNETSMLVLFLLSRRKDFHHVSSQH